MYDDYTLYNSTIVVVVNGGRMVVGEHSKILAGLWVTVMASVGIGDKSRKDIRHLVHPGRRCGVV